MEHPRQMVRSPLQEIDNLPLNEDDENSTQSANQSVSFSRNSEINRKLHPSIRYTTKWNQDCKESTDGVENVENQSKSANVYDGPTEIQYQNLHKRKRTSTLELSLNPTNLEGGELKMESMQQNGETRISKHRRSSMECSRTEVVEAKDMTEFYDELNLTEPIKYGSMIQHSMMESMYLRSTLSSNSSKESLNETYTYEDGMDLTVSLGEIKGNKSEDCPNNDRIETKILREEKVDDEAVGYNVGDKSNSEELGMELTIPLGGLSGKNEDPIECTSTGSPPEKKPDAEAVVIELSVPLEVPEAETFGNIPEDVGVIAQNVNEYVVNESVRETPFGDKSNSEEMGMELTIPWGGMSGKNADSIECTSTGSPPEKKPDAEAVVIELSVPLEVPQAETFGNIPEDVGVIAQSVNLSVRETPFGDKSNSEEMGMELTISLGGLSGKNADPIECMSMGSPPEKKPDAEAVVIELSVPLEVPQAETFGNIPEDVGIIAQNVNEYVVNESVRETSFGDKSNSEELGMELTIPLGGMSRKNADSIECTSMGSPPEKKPDAEAVVIELSVPLEVPQAETFGNIPEDIGVIAQSVNLSVRETPFGDKSNSEEMGMELTISLGGLSGKNADPIECTSTGSPPEKKPDAEAVVTELSVPFEDPQAETFGNIPEDVGIIAQNVNESVRETSFGEKSNSEEMGMELTIPLGGLSGKNADPIECTSTGSPPEKKPDAEAVVTELSVPFEDPQAETFGNIPEDVGIIAQNVNESVRETSFGDKSNSEEMGMELTISLGGMSRKNADPIECTSTGSPPEKKPDAEAVVIELSVPLEVPEAETFGNIPEDVGVIAQNVNEYVVNESVRETPFGDKSNSEEMGMELTIPWGGMSGKNADSIECTSTGSPPEKKPDAEAVVIELSVPLEVPEAETFGNIPEDIGVIAQNVNESVRETPFGDKRNSEEMGMELTIPLGRLSGKNADPIECTSTGSPPEKKPDAEAVVTELSVPFEDPQAETFGNIPEDVGIIAQNVNESVRETSFGDKSNSEEMGMELTISLGGMSRKNADPIECTSTGSPPEKKPDAEAVVIELSVPLEVPEAETFGNIPEDVGVIAQNVNEYVVNESVRETPFGDKSNSEEMGMELTIPWGGMSGKNADSIECTSTGSPPEKKPDAEAVVIELSVPLEVPEAETFGNIPEDIGVIAQNVNESVRETPFGDKRNSEEMGMELTIPLGRLSGMNADPIECMSTGSPSEKKPDAEAVVTELSFPSEDPQAETFGNIAEDTGVIAQNVNEYVVNESVRETPFGDTSNSEEMGMELTIPLGKFSGEKVELVNNAAREMTVVGDSCDEALDMELTVTMGKLKMEMYTNGSGNGGAASQTSDVEFDSPVQMMKLVNDGNAGMDGESPDVIPMRPSSGIVNVAFVPSELLVDIVEGRDEPSKSGTFPLVVNETCSYGKGSLQDPVTKLNCSTSESEPSKLAGTADSVVIESCVKSQSTQEFSKLTKSIEDWILEESKKESCHWVVCKVHENQYSFKVFHEEALLVVNLELLGEGQDASYNRSVRSVHLEPFETDVIDPVMAIVIKALIHRLPSDVLSSKCQSVGELPTLLEYIRAHLKDIELLITQAYRLMQGSSAKFTKDGFSFRVLHTKPMVFFEVTVCLLEWENGGIKPEAITIRNVLGNTRLSDIQAVIRDIRQDENYFMRLFDDVYQFISSLENVKEVQES